MSLSLYAVTIPPFIRSLGNLSAILDKGRQHALDNGIDPAELAKARLFEDMAPLTGQIQRASDTARFVAVRVGQVEAMPMADTEQTFEEMQARIAATIAFLRHVPANCMDGREQAEVTLTTRGGSTVYTATDYVLGFAVPNFYFHVTTAYDILRHRGVPIGKMDYIGRR